MAAKSNPIRVVFMIVLAVVAVSAVSYLLRPKELIDWRTDYAAARVEADRSHKFLVVYLTATWCGPCQQMRRTTWSDKNVQTAMEDFVPVKIDIDQQTDLARTLSKDEGIPEFIMMTAGGQTVMTTAGFMEPDQFIKWLRGRPI
jgi:thiol:disulfide interchange protein